MRGIAHRNTLATVGIAALTVALIWLLTWGLITANLIAAVVAGAGLAVDIVIGGSVVLLVP
ncbi:MAG: sensor histidine kinase, partial [Parafannyhessea sp.]